MTTLIEHCRNLLILLPICFSGGCISTGDSGGGETIAPPANQPQVTENFTEPARVERHQDYRLPSQVSICGEPLDLRKRSVYERLEREFISIVNHPAQVALWQRRAAVYFPTIEAELRAAGLPEDLKYLAMAESDLRPWIASPAGAVGIWQFMPATARQFGLTVTQNVDQRQLPEPILGAAKKYLKSLHNKFGNWALAMAAYNAGDGRVARAISAQGTRDYYQLDLPRETERYVYRIAAIKVVMENSAGYGLNMPVPRSHYHPVKYSQRAVDFKTAVTWTELAKKLGCDYKELRLLNPHIRTASLSGSYQLRVPAGSQKKLAE